MCTQRHWNEICAFILLSNYLGIVNPYIPYLLILNSSTDRWSTVIQICPSSGPANHCDSSFLWHCNISPLVLQMWLLKRDLPTKKRFSDSAFSHLCCTKTSRQRKAKKWSPDTKS
ncbi:hypothetical protein ECG_08724 [Echinococcus granulosus]|nr:hypothetical protein ECG_08724 [Echinococcus granulosus]